MAATKAEIYNIFRVNSLRPSYSDKIEVANLKYFIISTAVKNVSLEKSFKY